MGDIKLEIKFTKDAVKQIKKLNQPLKDRVREGVYRLPDGDVVKLQGYSTKYRLRIGDYRIIFDMRDNIITIGEILPRGEAYKR